MSEFMQSCNMDERTNEEKIHDQLIKKIKKEFEPHVLINTHLAQEIIDLVEQSQLEHIVKWVIKHGFSTGHADTIESLLSEIELDITEMRSLIKCKKES